MSSPGSPDGRRRRLLSLGIPALLALSILVPLAVYGRLYLDNPRRTSVFSPDTFQVAWRMVLAIPHFYRDALRSGPRVATLALEITPHNLQRIVDKRAEALRRGVLFASRDDLVAARLRSGGRTVAVDVRLKGDLSDHWARRRWSLRVEVRGGEEVLGLQRFSLHPPWARGFHSEPLFFDLLRAAGVVAPRTEFVELTVNGRAIGLMEVEEHLTSGLLEHLGRPVGVLMKLDEERLWRAWVRAAEERGVPWSLAVPKPLAADDWRTAAIDPFGGQTIHGSPRRSAELARAGELLRGVASGAIAPSKAFDGELWGRFLAYCEVFGAPHMVLWNNLRFYFNPASDRIEPVAFDSGVLPERNRRLLGAGASFGCLGGDLEFADTLIGDETLRTAFLAALRDLDVTVHSPAFEAFLRRREAVYLRILRTEYPWLDPFDLDAARRRAASLRRIGEESFFDHVHPSRRR